METIIDFVFSDGFIDVIQCNNCFVFKNLFGELC